MRFEVQNFCFLSLCGFGALWSSKLLFVLSLCMFGALWSLNLLFALCLWRFGMTNGLLSKCTISQGFGIVCLKMFFLFALVFWFRGLTIILRFGRRADSSKKAFRFQKQGVFSTKTILEQGWLHKRTRPVNRQERQCVDEEFWISDGEVRF